MGLKIIQQTGQYFIDSLERLGLINIKQSFFLDTQADTSLEQARPPSGPSYLIAGPEGGFSDEERNWIRQLGASPIKLGPRILRTETAALAALSIMQQCWGDL